MDELIKIIIGLIVLALGIPLGNYLARWTREELKDGQKWFKVVSLIALVGSIASLILGNDAILFFLLFVAIVTSRSLKR